MRTYCLAQGSLLNSLWWPKWEGNPQKRGYIYMYSWFTFLYSRNQLNNVNQLYLNRFIFKCNQCYYQNTSLIVSESNQNLVISPRLHCYHLCSTPTICYPEYWRSLIAGHPVSDLVHQLEWHGFYVKQIMSFHCWKPFHISSSHAKCGV